MYPSRCCVVAAWNIGSITSRCSRKELETGAKNRADLKHGQDVVIDVNFNCSFKLTLLVHKEIFAGGSIITQSWHSLEKLPTYTLCNNTRSFHTVDPVPPRVCYYSYHSNASCIRNRQHISRSFLKHSNSLWVRNHAKSLRLYKNSSWGPWQTRSPPSCNFKVLEEWRFECQSR